MTLVQRFYLLLADLVLVLHAGFVMFVVGGLIVIWIGWARGWRFVRNRWFRLAHLTAIGIVVAESALDWVCPLTTWEERLRYLAGAEERYAGSFIQHWVHQMLFFTWDERIFTAVYIGFFLAVMLTLWVIPPNWRAGAIRSST